MTNDDLEKKIAEIIDGSVDDWATRDRRGRIQVHVSTIADILVKAGLKFDASISHTATFDMLQQDRINELEKRIAEAEHRAARAERALQKFAETITCEDCPFFSDCASSEKMEDLIHSSYCFAEYLRQAEKELAEENDGKKEV